MSTLIIEVGSSTSKAIVRLFDGRFHHVVSLSGEPVLLSSLMYTETHCLIPISSTSIQGFHFESTVFSISSHRWMSEAPLHNLTYSQQHLTFKDELSFVKSQIMECHFCLYLSCLKYYISHKYNISDLTDVVMILDDHLLSGSLPSETDHVTSKSDNFVAAALAAGFSKASCIPWSESISCRYSPSYPNSSVVFIDIGFSCTKIVKVDYSLLSTQFYSPIEDIRTGSVRSFNFGTALLDETFLKNTQYDRDSCKPSELFQFLKVCQTIRTQVSDYEEYEDQRLCESPFKYEDGLILIEQYEERCNFSVLFAPVEKHLKELNDKNNISEFILTGGGSLIPFIEERIYRLFPGKVKMCIGPLSAVEFPSNFVDTKSLKNRDLYKSASSFVMMCTIFNQRTPLRI
ncbi:hypothetical protein GEMRC1_007610 [Eukaryota sp. GEM-RC1]